MFFRRRGLLTRGVPTTRFEISYQHQAIPNPMGDVYVTYVGSTYPSDLVGCRDIGWRPERKQPFPGEPGGEHEREAKPMRGGLPPVGRFDAGDPLWSRRGQAV